MRLRSHAIVAWPRPTNMRHAQAPKAASPPGEVPKRAREIAVKDSRHCAAEGAVTDRVFVRDIRLSEHRRGPLRPSSCPSRLILVSRNLECCELRLPQVWFVRDIRSALAPEPLRSLQQPFSGFAGYSRSANTTSNCCANKLAVVSKSPRHLVELSGCAAL